MVSLAQHGSGEQQGSIQQVLVQALVFPVGVVQALRVRLGLGAAHDGAGQQAGLGLIGELQLSLQLQFSLQQFP